MTDLNDANDPVDVAAILGFDPDAVTSPTAEPATPAEPFFTPAPPDPAPAPVFEMPAPVAQPTPVVAEPVSPNQMTSAPVPAVAPVAPQVAPEPPVAAPDSQPAPAPGFSAAPTAPPPPAEAPHAGPSAVPTIPPPSGPSAGLGTPMPPLVAPPTTPPPSSPSSSAPGAATLPMHARHVTGPAVPTHVPGNIDELTERDEHRLRREGIQIAERPALERLLCGMVWNGGSDLHLVHGEPPRMRVAGALLPIAGELPMTTEDIDALLSTALNSHAWAEYNEKNDLDTSYSMDETLGAAATSRFRVNVFRSMGTTGCVIRVIPTKIATLDDLGVPRQIKQLAEAPRGFVIFTGPTGSGKALALSTRVPTPTGWTTMGALKKGDLVLGRDGKPCRVTSLSAVEEKPDLYRVHLSDGQTVVADGQHQWLVSDHHNRSLPRTKKRLAAVERHDAALAVADRLEALAWEAGSEALTADEILAILGDEGLAREFPSKAAVANALRITDCPSWPSTRPNPNQVLPTYTRTEKATFYPTHDVLAAIAASPSPRAVLAAEVLDANVDSLPAEATAKQIGQILGGVPHTVASDVVRKAGIVGHPGTFEFTGEVPGRATCSRTVYPLDVALKCLANRLRQRFSDRPAAVAGMTRMDTEEMLAAGLRLKQGHSNFAVPLAVPLDLPEADLPVDPYLMGAWLGDGSTGTNHITSDPTPRSDDPDGSSDRSHLLRHIAAAGCSAVESPSAPFRVVVPDLLRWKGPDGLRVAGVVDVKYIPVAYLRASADQRLALLQGLMDTDGTVDINGTCELSLSDKRLATDALDLIRSLGIKASMSADRPASYRDGDGNLVECKDRHRIHFTTATPVFRLPRKAARQKTDVRETQKWIYITDIEPVSPDDPDYEAARCITVDSPDHAYLCGDGYVVTSNSTTMAGLVDLINETRSERIFTLEDPVEFTHKSKKCLVSHREIGEDTPSFEEGLRRVRREDPDIILIGEMRDYHTIAAAIEAADTGHLVIATLHTNSAPETISRIINQFPANQQDQVRVTLASTLLAVISQTLVEAPQTERGRVLATEIMLVNAGIRNNIRENDIPAIAAALIDQSSGNLSLDAHLAQLIRQGIITKRAAEKKCSSKANLEQMLGNFRDGGRS